MKNLTLLLVALTFFVSSKTTWAESDSTAKQVADMNRFLYYLVAGPPSSGYPDGYDGPEDGLVGVFADIISKLKSALASGAGVNNCSEIPASGSSTITVDNSNYTVTFNTPSKTIPAGWTNAGTTLAKSVSIATTAGTTFLKVEIDCSSTATYFRMDMEAIGQEARSFEAYYMDTTTSGVVDRRVLFAMNYDSSSEKFMIDFWTNGTNYSTYAIRSANDGSGLRGMSVAMYGNKDTGIVLAGGIQDNDGTVNNTTTPGNFTQKICVNATSNTVHSDCSGLTIDTPSNAPAMSSSSSSETAAYTMNFVANFLSLETL